MEVDVIDDKEIIHNFFIKSLDYNFGISETIPYSYKFYREGVEIEKNGCLLPVEQKIFDDFKDRVITA